MKASLKWKIAQKLEIGWWRRYLRQKNPEEYLAWKKAYWQSFYQHIAAQIPIEPHWQIADLGCGPAGIFCLFSEYSVQAVDPLIPLYKSRLQVFDPDKYPNVNFVTSTLEAFTPDHTFQLTFCLNAINHVSNLSLAFQKLGLLTAEGGYCALSIDAHNYNLLKWLFRLVPGDALHPHQHNRTEYEEMFMNAGFELQKTQLIKKGGIFNYYLLLGKKVTP